MALLNKPSARPAMPDALLSIGERHTVEGGTVLFLQGESAERCFFLEKGEVALRRLSASGDEVEIARITEGEWFGEVILFAARSYPAQAVAVRESVLLEFRRSSVLAARDVAVSAFFLELLARKCLSLNRRIEQLTIMPVRERVARFILGLCPGRAAGCSGSGRNCEVPLPRKKREIASELGMAPETLSRTLAAMEAEGLIRVRGSRIEIPVCTDLRALLEGD